MSVQALSWVLEESKSKGTDRLVLIALANHLGYRNEEQGCWPSVRLIAHEAGGIDEQTVRRSLKRLEALGELVVTRSDGGRGNTNLYRLVEFLNTEPRQSAGVPGGGNTGTGDRETAHRNPGNSHRNPGRSGRNSGTGDRGISNRTGEPTGDPVASTQRAQAERLRRDAERAARLDAEDGPPAPMPNHLRRRKVTPQ